jgi:TolB-like protein/DNA-binding winged helix-turn-helix (wHTH) protein
MVPPAPSSQTVRFAQFEVDLRAGELRKQGRRLRLQEQPLRVLAMLVDRAGELVTREELQQKLWPADTFVDFDHGLNSAVARLRDTLSDSAERPKYIETVARRGYRFIGRLEEGGGETEARQVLHSGGGVKDRPRATTWKWARWGSLLAAIVVTASASTAYFLRHSAHSEALGKPIDSVAVLPFENAAASSDTDYLADGITQSAIDRLSRLGNLRVISLGSVLRYRGRRDDPRQIGSDLGVRSVMLGKIDFHGDRMEVMAELVDTTDGRHIWGEQYDRKVSDIMSVQEDIAREIATKLEVRLSNQQEKVLQRRYTQDFEAYEIYLRGRYYWNRRSQEDLKRGIAYFQQAIERDPENALAYAGLADSYFVRAISGALPSSEAMPKAKAAAQKALELDDSLAEAHTSLAQITANYEWNWDKAESEYRKAIELNPSYSTGHHYYATFLMAMGRHAEALREMKRAEALDPLSPIIATFVAQAYYYAGENDEAIKRYGQVLSSDPEFQVARSFLIHSLEQAGRFDEAVAQRKIVAAQAGRGSDGTGELDRAYRAAGPGGYWNEVLRQVHRGREAGPGSDLDIAAIYSKLGNREQAFDLLERAYGERNMWLMNLKVDPRFDSLRADPRFDTLLRRIGLA